MKAVAGKKRPSRAKNPEKTRANIIDVATAEFAERGLSGARVDQIAERTNTSKRMLYYYFGDKDGLYRAVLLSYYEKLRSSEVQLDLSHQSPLAALQALVEFTFDYHMKHADIVRLVMVENMHKGRHVAKLPQVMPINTSVLDAVADICERGAREGSMRTGLDNFDLYTTIAALCFFNVSNRYTFRAIFKHDMAQPKESDARRKSIWDVIHRFVVP
ncbi:MAG TPA: TetR/AcrR family transcriptional regulator [Rhizomicrobium sp.]|nr:TetR/AcrR family transcriptional regulator [Rhizomicrobium sp.]